jgi:DNA repair exonuclease SbcCD nuclease subunit
MPDPLANGVGTPSASTGSQPTDAGLQVSDASERLPASAHSHSVRMIHTSDVHVGTGFALDESGREEALVFMETIVNAATDLDADLVVIAGDFFDNNRVKEPLVQATAEIISATEKPVVILPGNHDPFMSGSMYQRFAHHFADNVHIFDSPDGTLFSLDDIGVQIWGQAHASYDDFSPADASPAWRGDTERPFWRIAMAHGSAVGFDGRLSFGYRIEEEHLADLEAHYVALGHLDRHGQTGPPGTTAFYSGAPGLLKGFTLVDLQPHGVNVQPILFDALERGEAPAR